MTNYTNYQTNTFEGGLNQDTNINYINTNQYIDAKNVRITKQEGSTNSILQNIKTLGSSTLVQQNSTATTTLYGTFSNSTIIGCTNTYYYLNDSLQEVAIILTYYNNYNSLYMVAGLGTTSPLLYRICIFYGSINSEVSMVANYEAEDNVKVYIADGKSFIKMINIGNIVFTTSSKYIGNAGDLNIYPDSSLTPAVFNDTISGNLMCGVYCYTYRLINKYGQSTPIAPLSNLIPVYNTSGISSATSSSNMGIKIKLTIADGFDYAYIYRIYYNSNNQEPEVSLVSQMYLSDYVSSVLDFDDIPAEYTYSDIDNNVIESAITIEELNNLNRKEFYPKTIVKLQNRLFASNVNEDTWDITYDAKAYRFNSYSTQICAVIDDFEETKYYNNIIPNRTYDQASINPINLILDLDGQIDTLASSGVGKDYLYQLNSIQTYGGTGLNISYEFVTATLVECIDGNANGYDIESIPSTNKTVDIRNQSGTLVAQYSIPENCYSYPFNYKNPYISTNFVGYQRDEIYRFGIVFYNKKGKASPVHWIGDIRIPSGKGERFCPFHMGDTYDVTYTSDMLISRPIGIKFNVGNLPSEVTGYEIVRCKRTTSDKTVITQGVLTNTYHNNEDDKGTRSDTSNLLRPTYFLSNVISYGSDGSGSINEQAIRYCHLEGGTTPGYKTTQLTSCPTINMLITPEICFAGTEAKQLIKSGNYIVKVNSIYPSASETVTSNYESSSAIRTAINCSSTIKYQPYSGLTYKDASNNLYYQFISSGYTSGVNFYDVETCSESQSSLLYKYFYFNEAKTISSSNSSLKHIISTVKYCDTVNTTNLINPSTSIYNLSANDINIKSYIYTNVNDPNWDIDMYHKLGAHGPGMLVYTEDLISQNMDTTELTVYTTSGTVNYLRSTLGIPIVNIKKYSSQYGGTKSSSIANSVYISTSSYTDREISSVIVFGGDTYTGILQYPISTAWIYDQNSLFYSDMKVASTALLPLESQYNINLQYGNTFSESSSKLWYQVNAGSLGSIYSQDKPFFAYNDAYNTPHNDIIYLAKSLITEDNQRHFNRIVCSEAKSNGEVEDSWCVFKFANYIDTDTQYGEITNMLSFKDKLFFWQKNSFGIASVNERSLIQDNNTSALTLGTGGILVRYDYITNINGDSKYNDRSIINSDSNIFWYDIDKNEILISNGQSIQSLSKIKNVQTYLNQDNTNLKYSLYDRKNNEVRFQFENEQLTYNENINAFTSRYIVDSNWCISTSNDITYVNNANVFINDKYTTKLDNSASIKFIVNKDLIYTKSFDNVDFSGILSNLVFTSADFNTKTQTSQTVSNTDIDLREDNYRFYIPRDSLVVEEEFYIPARMKGKYLICEYKFNCNDDKSFEIPYIRTAYRYSKL